MGKIEIKKIPKELHPAGEQILKIMEDDKEPPKDYIWKKEGEYFVWNGKKWVPYEFEIITGNGCIQKNCCCVGKDEMAVKFNKFKKDVLAAVLKMNKTQDATNIADIRAQLSELKVIIHQLEEFENYYTKDEIDAKTNALNTITTVLNGSISSLSRKVAGVETSISNIYPILNKLNAIDHSQFITARDVSEDYEYDPEGHLIGNFATKEYVNNAISNLIGDASNSYDTLQELGDALATKADKSEIPESYDDSELRDRITDLENNPVVDPTIVDRIKVLENKPFDEYLTNNEALVISTSLNDLNSRLSTVENKPFDSYLTENDEYVIASGLTDLDSRVSKLEETVEEESSKEYLTEKDELVITAALNDLNDRVVTLENN